MKNFILFILIFASFFALKAQQTCVTAVNIIPATTCNYSSHTTNGTEYWLKFTATSQTVNISLITTKFGINAPHVHNLALYSGNCSIPVLVADDELPFVDDAKELAIDLNASGLIIGQTYYIRATRTASLSVGTCDKSGCTSNGSTDPTSFDICVQDIDVIIPKDFGFEPPSVSHAYTVNRGQLVDVNGNPIPQIKLYNDRTSPAVYIADDKISYVFSRIDTNTATPDTLHRVDVSLVGSTPTKAFKTEQISGYTNYYLGHIPAGVTDNKSYSRAVCNDVYPNIDMQYYSNQEGLKYYFIVKPGGDPDNIILKFDGATAINVTPTGGLEIITSIGTLAFEPPHAYRVNAAGNVVPMPWQAKFEAIPASANEVKFKTHSYDPIMPLFIQVDRGHSQPPQPQSIANLEWSTYVGGSADDFGLDVKNDNFGNVFITGYTGSTNFPFTIGSFIQPTFAGYYDAFVSKFDSQAQFLWSTYYGGSYTDPVANGDDRALSLLVSNDGFIYFVGVTKSANFPTADNTTTSPYFQNYFSGERDGFLVSLRGNGSLRWATYYGGYTRDAIHKITEDNLGNLIISGSVDFYQQISPYASIEAGDPSCNVPTTNRGFPSCSTIPSSYFNDKHSGGFDCFIAKFDGDRRLSWSTFFGGVENDVAWDVIADKTDNSFYIGGYTQSSIVGNNNTTSPCNAPTNNGFPLCNLGGNSYFQGSYPSSFVNAFISKFDSQNQLIWSTFFGAKDEMMIHHLALNSLGDLYAVGKARTSSNIDIPDLYCVPPTNGGFPLCNSGSGAFYVDNDNVDVQDEVFITKFNTNKQITWSTFFGSTGDENNSLIPEDGTINIAIDNSDRVYLLGNSEKVSGTNGDLFIQPYPSISPTFYNQSTNNGSGITRDAFIATFNSSNKLIWSTYFGGGGTTVNASDLGHGITIDNNNNKLYITGGTVSTTFPTTCPSTTNPYCISSLSNSGWYDAYISKFDLSYVIGIEDNYINDNGLLLFPNPTTGEITLKIELLDNTDIDIVLYNSLGQLLSNDHYKKQNGVFKHTIELSVKFHKVVV
jgi:hypothetical protein